MKNKRIVPLIIKVVLVVLLSIVLVFNVCIMIQAKTKPNSVPSIFGYKPFVVLSGSMESEINVGDLVFVKEVNSSELNVNDVIAFRTDDNKVTTHRIVNIKNENGKLCFETKGDANNIKDESIVCEDSVEGKYYSKISKVGNLIIFIQEPLGFTIMMMAIFIVCIFIYFISSKKIDKDLEMTEEERKAHFICSMEEI